MNYSNIVAMHAENQRKEQEMLRIQQQQQLELLQRQQMEQQYHQQQQHQVEGESTEQVAEYFRIFDQAVTRIFKEWTALQLALSHQWGGNASLEKAEEMRQDILDLFVDNQRVYPDQIEKILDECLSQDLNTVAEDGSYKQVANMIIQSYVFCVNNQMMELVALLGPETQSAVQNCVGTGVNDDDDESIDDDSQDDDMMVDDSNSNNNTNNNNNNNYNANEPDEDGWVTVGTKGRNRK
ncbi:hypothetical protein DLAC_02895 [Tieghemostelium lacteum]|uniref:Pre-rRNA-processing protein TSR2 n=1 Tax=Tieghemostelium lacteum TaxID=361077 RepID=A0A152A3P8_TIELA|nr:hypothetical protein DLAC_02895 [Tieghemostelium lacteum]|eukprot:KYR00840.1 hypothetical protein DLAC_02895 [Tieghemostelium lacteum]